MAGRQHDEDASFNEETLNGVASLLCRVGIRPNSSSPLAAVVVANFMAVLSYVSHTHDRFVVSYSSDPMLTLGAVRVWHDTRKMLAEKILPQLHRLLSQEVVDTGDVDGDVMVARIVLLLSMDACTQLELGSGERSYVGAGEFFSVWTFLKALHGLKPKLRVPKDTNTDAAKITSSSFKDASAEDTKAALTAVEDRWKDWSLSFTHFVQLVELPSEVCLWAMLARRAAGIMPRDQKAVDLVIPVCTLQSMAAGKTEDTDTDQGTDTNQDEDQDQDGDQDEDQDGQAYPRVSMILVHVKNRASVGPSFADPEKMMMKASVAPMSDRAKATADPNLATAATESVAEVDMSAALGPDTILLRVYMSVRAAKVERFYVEDQLPDGRRPTAHALCLYGLGPIQLGSDADRLAKGRHLNDVDVLTTEVVRELQKLLSPWWNMKTLVEQDVDLRVKRTRCFGPTKKEAVRVAKQPLGDVLVLNGIDDETTSSANFPGPDNLAVCPVDRGQREPVAV